MSSFEYTLKTSTGVMLVAVPERGACDGCWGDGTSSQTGRCAELPVDCAERKIIWVRKTKASTIKAGILALEGR